MPAIALFFLRLAATLLLEKHFPALPEGLSILITLDQSRVAGRHLSRRLREEQPTFMRRQSSQLPREPRRPGLTAHSGTAGSMGVWRAGN